MIKKLLPALAVIVLLASCSSLKPVGFTSNKQTVAPAAVNEVPVSQANKNEIKFLENIAVDPQATIMEHQAVTTSKKSDAAKGKPASDIEAYLNRGPSIENASPLQLKYALLLNTDVEQLDNLDLLESVDEWYGTPYRYGGTTKKGVDCSAFVQAVYLATFAVSLPRTARDQYHSSRIISAVELKEGDLLFFNTTGGISHVGIYLRNNKFVHASSSQGVVISDIFDSYYLKRYIGAGRIEKPAANN